MAFRILPRRGLRTEWAPPEAFARVYPRADVALALAVLASRDLQARPALKEASARVAVQDMKTKQILWRDGQPCPSIQLLD